MGNLVEEVECITGIVFDDLSNREIRGALLAISAIEALPAHLSEDERSERRELIMEEFVILDEDYKERG